MVSGNERTFSPLPFGRRGIFVLRTQTWNGKPSTVPDCSVVAACHTPGKDALEEISSLIDLPKVAARADKHIMPLVWNGGMGVYYAYRHVAPMAGIGRDSGASLNLAILYHAFHLCQ